MRLFGENSDFLATDLHRCTRMRSRRERAGCPLYGQTSWRTGTSRARVIRLRFLSLERVAEMPSTFMAEDLDDFPHPTAFPDRARRGCRRECTRRQIPLWNRSADISR